MKECFFHFGQCLHRRVKALKFQRAYNADGGGNELRHYVRRHAALALLLLNEVITVLQLIRQQRPANLDDDDRERLVAFNAYFTQQWVETLSPNTWNHFDNDGPRTNNHLEGYHRKLNMEFNRSHPSIYRFIGVQQSHEEDYRVKVQ